MWDRARENIVSMIVKTECTVRGHFVNYEWTARTSLVARLSHVCEMDMHMS